MLTDEESDEFGIARGAKQGDPLSSLLFNSVLQSAMEKDIETWKEKGLGIKLSDDRWSPISKSSEAHGLGIQPSKTKILTNQNTNKLREMEMDEMHVERLPPEGKVKHLRR